jgi:hypothetical protein
MAPKYSPAVDARQELERRYTESTTREYSQIVQDYAGYFHRSPVLTTRQEKSSSVRIFEAGGALPDYVMLTNDATQRQRGFQNG